MTNLPSQRESSSSEAASAAHPSPTTSPKWGGRTSSCSNAGNCTCGSTWHSAGLVGQLRSDFNLTRMMKYSTDLYRRLKDETGQDTGWREVGGLRLASTPQRMEELKRQVGFARSFGMPLEMISTAQAKKMFPLMNDRGRAGGGVDPDGRQHRSDRADDGTGGGRQEPRRPHLHSTPRSPASPPRTARWTRSSPIRGGSRPRSWSTAPASGAASSPRWSASRCPSCPSPTCT